MNRNFKEKAIKSMAIMMAAASMAGTLAVPAFAAPTKGNTSSEKVTYYKNDGTTEDVNSETSMLFDVTDGAYGGTVSKATKVEVEQGASVSVKVPFKIVLDGTRGAENDATYQVTVKGDIAGDTQINVVPNTATAVKNSGLSGEAAAQENNFADGSGTFKMAERAGVKKAITATITQADTSWTMADDGSDDGSGAASLNATKEGTVKVVNLSAGAWSNDIGFDISATDITAGD